MSRRPDDPARGARFDRRLARRRGLIELAGVDEVGRGCLAGPVVVAAVLVPAGLRLEGVRDSKALSAAARERLFARLRTSPITWAAVCVDAATVDELNVLGASLWGMQRAVDRLESRVGRPIGHVLVDGDRLPRTLEGRATAIVKGDARSQCVGAASVVAKVARDRLMRAWARRLPGYGFERNVGYPTADHLEALRRLGPTRLHRRSFAPVAKVAAQGRSNGDLPDLPGSKSD